MSVRTNPALGLRPFLPQDVSLLADIFRASVEELTADDYTVTEQAAWLSTIDDEDMFGARLAKALTLLASMDGSVVGFIALAGDKIDMLYVHPSAVSQGVASMLYDAIEKLAVSRGIAKLTADVSETAYEFFEHRGFAPHHRKTVAIEGEWLACTVMEKQLSAQGKQS